RPAVRVLVEAPAVLRGLRGTDPGLHRDRVLQIEARRGRHHHRRARAREGGGGVTAHRAGLTQGHPGVDRADKTVATGIGGAGAPRGIAQTPEGTRMIAEDLLGGAADLEHPERAAQALAAPGTAALA